MLLLALMAIWYVAVVPMNVQETLTRAERAEIAVTPATAVERRDTGTWALVFGNLGALGESWSLDRPRLPAPHPSALKSERK